MDTNRQIFVKREKWAWPDKNQGIQRFVGYYFLSFQCCTFGRFLSPLEVLLKWAGIVGIVRGTQNIVKRRRRCQRPVISVVFRRRVGRNDSHRHRQEQESRQRAGHRNRLTLTMRTTLTTV